MVTTNYLLMLGVGTVFALLLALANHAAHAYLATPESWRRDIPGRFGTSGLPICRPRRRRLLGVRQPAQLSLPRRRRHPARVGPGPLVLGPPGLRPRPGLRLRRPGRHRSGVLHVDLPEFVQRRRSGQGRRRLGQAKRRPNTISGDAWICVRSSLPLDPSNYRASAASRNWAVTSSTPLSFHTSSCKRNRCALTWELNRTCGPTSNSWGIIAARKTV